MKETVLIACIIHMMASFNILKAITVFTDKKKANSLDNQVAPELNEEPSEANGGKKKYK